MRAAPGSILGLAGRSAHIYIAVGVGPGGQPTSTQWVWVGVAGRPGSTKWCGGRVGWLAQIHRVPRGRALGSRPQCTDGSGWGWGMGASSTHRALRSSAAEILPDRHGLTFIHLSASRRCLTIFVWVFVSWGSEGFCGEYSSAPLLV